MKNPGIYSTSCAAINCDLNQQRHSSRFFAFPIDEARCGLWVVKCRRLDLFAVPPATLCEHYYLCEKHFEVNMFKVSYCVTMDTADQNKYPPRLILKDEAVPTLFDFPLVTYKVPYILSSALPPSTTVSGNDVSDEESGCKEVVLPGGVTFNSVNRVVRLKGDKLFICGGPLLTPGNLKISVKLNLSMDHEDIFEDTSKFAYVPAVIGYINLLRGISEMISIELFNVCFTYTAKRWLGSPLVFQHLKDGRIPNANCERSVPVPYDEFLAKVSLDYMMVQHSKTIFAERVLLESLPTKISRKMSDLKPGHPVYFAVAPPKPELSGQLDPGSSETSKKSKQQNTPFILRRNGYKEINKSLTVYKTRPCTSHVHSSRSLSTIPLKILPNSPKHESDSKLDLILLDSRQSEIAETGIDNDKEAIEEKNTNKNISLSAKYSIDTVIESNVKTSPNIDPGMSKPKSSNPLYISIPQFPHPVPIVIGQRLATSSSNSKYVKALMKLGIMHRGTNNECKSATVCETKPAATDVHPSVCKISLPLKILPNTPEKSLESNAGEIPLESGQTAISETWKDGEQNTTENLPPSVNDGTDSSSDIPSIFESSPKINPGMSILKTSIEPVNIASPPFTGALPALIGHQHGASSSVPKHQTVLLKFRIVGNGSNNEANESITVCETRSSAIDDQPSVSITPAPLKILDCTRKKYSESNPDLIPLKLKQSEISIDHVEESIKKENIIENVPLSVKGLLSIKESIEQSPPKVNPVASKLKPFKPVCFAISQSSSQNRPKQLKASLKFGRRNTDREDNNCGIVCNNKSGTPSTSQSDYPVQGGTIIVQRQKCNGSELNDCEGDGKPLLNPLRRYSNCKVKRFYQRSGKTPAHDGSGTTQQINNKEVDDVNSTCLIKVVNIATLRAGQSKPSDAVSIVTDNVHSNGSTIEETTPTLETHCGPLNYESINEMDDIHGGCNSCPIRTANELGQVCSQRVHQNDDVVKLNVNGACVKESDPETSMNIKDEKITIEGNYINQTSNLEGLLKEVNRMPISDQIKSRLNIALCNNKKVKGLCKNNSTIFAKRKLIKIPVSDFPPRISAETITGMLAKILNKSPKKKYRPNCMESLEHRNDSSTSSSTSFGNDGNQENLKRREVNEVPTTVASSDEASFGVVAASTKAGNAAGTVDKAAPSPRLREVSTGVNDVPTRTENVSYKVTKIRGNIGKGHTYSNSPFENPINDKKATQVYFFNPRESKIILPENADESADKSCKHIEHAYSGNIKALSVTKDNLSERIKDLVKKIAPSSSKVMIIKEKRANKSIIHREEASKSNSSVISTFPLGDLVGLPQVSVDRLTPGCIQSEVALGPGRKAHLTEVELDGDRVPDHIKLIINNYCNEKVSKLMLIKEKKEFSEDNSTLMDRVGRPVTPLIQENSNVTRDTEVMDIETEIIDPETFVNETISTDLSAAEIMHRIIGCPDQNSPSGFISENQISPHSCHSDGLVNSSSEAGVSLELEPAKITEVSIKDESLSAPLKNIIKNINPSAVKVTVVKDPNATVKPGITNNTSGRIPDHIRELIKSVHPNAGKVIILKGKNLNEETAFNNTCLNKFLKPSDQENLISKLDNAPYSNMSNAPSGDFTVKPATSRDVSCKRLNCYCGGEPLPNFTRIDKRNVQHMPPKLKPLGLHVLDLKKQIYMLKKKTQRLTAKNRALRLKPKVKFNHLMDEMKKYLCDDAYFLLSSTLQHSVQQVEPTGCRYPDEVKKVGAKILATGGQQCYNYLSSIFSLPAKNTMRKYLNDLVAQLGTEEDSTPTEDTDHNQNYCVEITSIPDIRVENRLDVESCSTPLSNKSTKRKTTARPNEPKKYHPVKRTKKAQIEPQYIEITLQPSVNHSDRNTPCTITSTDTEPPDSCETAQIDHMNMADVRKNHLLDATEEDIHETDMDEDEHYSIVNELVDDIENEVIIEGFNYSELDLVDCHIEL